MPWLMKAEPDSRIVNGKDVKFSVDDFEKLGVSQWDGVRNHVAKNIMKERMNVGDKVLFYHSNCKEPGVFALAEVAREGYPDYTAWDPSHPYFDPKTNKETPTWFMVDVRFVSRLPHPPSLALIKLLADAPSLPREVEYIGPAGHDGLKNMALVRQGRLSVQPVTDEAYDAVVAMGQKGGWDNLLVNSKGKKAKRVAEQEDGEQDERVAQPPKAPKVESKKSQTGTGRSKLETGAKDDITSRRGSTGSRRSSRVKVKA